MNKSDQIGQLADALAAAQGEIKAATKDSDNPFFKSKYADLGAVWNACREALSKHKLAISQVVDVQEGKQFLITMLMHASGEWLCSTYPIRPMDEKPQSLGSAITYARRYSLSAIVGIASEEDDDGNAASGRKEAASAAPKKERDWAKLKPTDSIDGTAPISAKKLPDDLCLFYVPFRQYQGVLFFDMPDKALEHIGQHLLTIEAKETKEIRKKWFVVLKESILAELADRIK